MECISDYLNFVTGKLTQNIKKRKILCTLNLSYIVDEDDCRDGFHPRDQQPY